MDITPEELETQFCDFVELNDFYNIELILKNKKNIFMEYYEWAFLYASNKGFFEIIILLLKYTKINPSIKNNYATRYANSNGHQKILCVLWNNITVKNTLKNHDIELYNELIKKDQLYNNIKGFK
jgi:hypothetical protein